MELGITLPTSGNFASTEAIIRVAQGAEEIGLDSIWTYERLLRPIAPVMQGGQLTVLPPHYASVYEPIETLTLAAAKTTKIKLGTSIIDALFHPPVVLAKRFATLDQFSGGRVIAGLGQGWMEEEFRAAGVPLKRKGAGFGEYIEALRVLWGPDPVQFHGRFYEIAESQFNPKPVQAGGPPIIVAANNPESLARTARLGDGINPFFRNREHFQQMVSGYLKLVQDAGRDPKRQKIIVRSNAHITDSPDEPHRPLNGSIEQIVEDLRWLKALEVDTVFFDMNNANTPIDDQLRYMRQMQAAMA